MAIRFHPRLGPRDIAAEIAALPADVWTLGGRRISRDSDEEDIPLYRTANRGKVAEFQQGDIVSRADLASEIFGQGGVNWAVETGNYTPGGYVNLDQFVQGPWSPWRPNADGTFNYDASRITAPYPEKPESGFDAFMETAIPAFVMGGGLATIGGGILGGAGLGAEGAAVNPSSFLNSSLADAANFGGTMTDFSSAAAANAGDLAALGDVTTAVGDPFIDAWSSYGGPTGLPLPGSPGFDWSTLTRVPIPMPAGGQDAGGGSDGGAMDMGVGDAAMRDQFLGLKPGNTDVMRVLQSLGLPAGIGNALLSGLASGNGGLLGLLGNGLNTFLGYNSAKEAADRTAALNAQMIAMAERDRQDRLPFINTATGWLNDPASLASGPWGQEIARQTARAIGGARQENLFDNPTGQSLVMQALAPTLFNTVTQVGNLGLRNTAPLAELGSIGLQNAQAQGRPDAVLGAGLGGIFNPSRTGLESQNELLRRVLQNSSYGTGVLA